MRRRSIYILVVAVLAVLTVGLIMLSSTGAFAADSRGDTSVFLRKQAVWLGIGMCAAIVASMMDYSIWRKTWPIWMGLSIVLLILCLPPFGSKINGSYRWIRLGGFSFQPSELAKLATITFAAFWYTRFEDQVKTFWKGFALPLLVVGVLMALIVVETDLGATMLIGATLLSIMFVAGARLRYFIPIALIGVTGIYMMATRMDERAGRLLAFRDLEKYKETDGLQQYAGLTALGSGGVEGLGLGNGRQKLLYLPFAHTDFIFPVIGEELGLRITLLIVFAYVVIVVAGIFVSLCARDRFGTLLGFGCVMLIAIQAVVNIGVTTALLPNKGMPLPFVSYGGTNLCICLLLIGILISIHRHGEPLSSVYLPKVLAARTRRPIRPIRL